MYWTDWKTKSIERVDKKTGKERVHVRRHLDGLMELHVVSENQQKGWTPCSVYNGYCSHLCLYRSLNKGYICACPDRYDKDCTTGNNPSVNYLDNVNC